VYGPDGVGTHDIEGHTALDDRRATSPVHGIPQDVGWSQMRPDIKLFLSAMRDSTTD